MLIRDLARLYGVTDGALAQAMKRNAARFPKDFVFRLTREELTNLKSQTMIPGWGGSRSRPYAFTEEGVAMLSSVLRSGRAVKVNIAIMRAFLQLREMLETIARSRASLLPAWSGGSGRCFLASAGHE